jgi:hypothetical protein
MRDLEWLALVLTLTILCFLVLAATQRARRREAEQPEIRR